MTNKNKKPTLTDKEEWRDIEGYEGYYQVSCFGKIRSCDREVNRLEYKTKKWGKRKVLSQNKELQQSKKLNYKIVSLYKNGVGKSLLVHRLVGKAFLSNSDNKPQINHKDGNKLNNHASNLEWVTMSENMLHACRVLKRKLPHSAFVEGENHVEAKPILLSKNGQIVSAFSHSTECAKNIIDEKGIKSCRTSIMKYARTNKLYHGYIMNYISKEEYNSIKLKYPAIQVIINRLPGTKRRLSEKQIKEIRKLLNEGLNCRQVSEKYPVSETAISRIKLNKAYNHVK